MANAIVHFEIEAKDGKRAKKFYEDAFGWKMDQMGDDMGGYIVVETTKPMTPGAINGGIFVSPPGDHEVLNAYSCVVAVDDIKTSMENVKKAGGTVMGEPMEIPTVGTYVKCKDTEGNNFSLLQPSPESQQKADEMRKEATK